MIFDWLIIECDAEFVLDNIFDVNYVIFLILSYNISCDYLIYLILSFNLICY